MSPAVLPSPELSPPYTPPAFLFNRLISVTVKNILSPLFPSLQTAPTNHFFSHYVNIHWAMCLEMSSPLWPLGGPYIFHLIWHLFDFVSAGEAMSFPLEKKPWKINHAHFLKVSYPISQMRKLEATSQRTAFGCWHGGYSLPFPFGETTCLFICSKFDCCFFC